MITVRMIQYWNDYHKKEIMERFQDLKELEEWIFGQMRVDYSSEHGRNLLSFPRCDVEGNIYRISVQPEHGSYVYWIKQIEEDHSGILFSDGTFTAGQKHCTKRLQEWLAECERRKKNPTFNFASDGSGAGGGLKENILYGYGDEPYMDKKGKSGRDDIISGQVIRKVAKRIHEIGGCDATDEYSEGYDDAINAALDILLEEIGCTIDEVLSYDGDRDS